MGSLSFANPAGAWALLGLLAVLAIHLLRLRAPRVASSTLFLLPPRPRSSPGGRALDRLRSSASLWLELAAVALLAWLLLAPQWLRDESRQRVVVVLDSSLSMAAFAPERRAAVEARLPVLAGAAARTDWAVVETALARRTLYAGEDLRAALASLASWAPGSSGHDVRPALAQARALAGAGGHVVFVTDHLAPAEGWGEGIEVLAAGRPFDNVGFLGASVDDEGGWRGLVRNHGAVPARCSWHAEVDGRRLPGGDVELGPGEARVLAGRFPDGADRLLLQLSGPAGDAFAVDDRLPLVRPRRKPLRVAVDAALREAGERLVGMLPGATLLAGDAEVDLRIAAVAPADGRAAILLDPRGAGDAAGWLKGPLVATRDPLTDGLSFEGLLVRAGAGARERPAAAQVLVWQAERPLVTREGARLFVDIPLGDSNALRHPGLVLLLHRFAETVRAARVDREAGNFELGSPLALALAADAPAAMLEVEGGGASDPGRAPVRPAFFRVRQGDEERLAGAAHFADAREADFTRAAAHVETAAPPSARRAASRRDDPLRSLWIALVALALCADWVWARRR